MHSIRIEGLSGFVAALGRVDAKYPKQLRQNNAEVAKTITRFSKRKAAEYAPSHRTERKAAKSLRSYSQSVAAVVEGGRNTPFFYGAEFGATAYRQFLKWRGNQWRGWEGGPGYFLHPTIRDHADELIEEYADKLEQLYREAFPS